MSQLIEFQHLSKNYGAAMALSDINLSLDKGKIIGLLGPNGSGKTTLIKLVNGLLQPSVGSVLIGGSLPGIETKKIVSYLPERTYLNAWMSVRQILTFFEDFYQDFDRVKALEMLRALKIEENQRLKAMSKGTKEKVQLILVMSRKAKLYLLDEPIGGVDPAARDYILNTILTNYSENSTVIISTHLIQDVEQIFDDIIFLENGHIRLFGQVDEIRSQYGKSIDELFREVFRC